jgi:hypothetical protein
LIIFSFLEVKDRIVDPCITDKLLCEMKFGEYELVMDNIGVDFGLGVFKI